jgi:hypothetical protein
LPYYSKECLNQHTIDIDIDVYDPMKVTAKTGHLTLCLSVSRPNIFTLSDWAFSTLELALQAMPQDIIKSLSLEQVQKLSPAWKQFLPAFSSVFSQTISLFNVP